MKKVLAVIAAVGCLTAASISFAGIAAGTGVNGSLHDMTLVVPGHADVMGRVCVYCHAPHHAIVKSTAGAGADQLPLWNHTIPTVAFTPYAWATPDNLTVNGQSFAITDPLAGPSRLCMSCHDGTIAVDQHGSAMQDAGTTVVGSVTSSFDRGRANLTQDLSNTHPIGFDYNMIANARNAGAAGGVDGNGNSFGSEIVRSVYRFATKITLSQTQGKYNLIERNGAKQIEDVLYNGNIMTCATCHEVHNKENATQEPFTGGANQNVLNTTQDTPNYFLYAKQKDSLICLSCHVK
jgi:Zn-finger protein